jgi:hypothetical protein
MSRETDLAWAAGFIDGEGCINIAHKSTISRYGKKYNYYSLAVMVGQITPEPLLKLKEMFGGHIRGPIIKENRRPSFMWSISSRNSADMLQKLLPYLIVKKSEALNALEFQKLTGRVGVKGLSEETVFKMKFYRDKLIEAHNASWSDI